MSAIHDLIAQVSDQRLRERLAAEWASASKEKKFGLVFEDHLPELLPLYNATPRRGDLVCRRDSSLKHVWQVQQIRDGIATCVKPGNDVRPSSPHSTEAGAGAGAGSGAAREIFQWSLDELLVVREFGEPIFPSLVPVDTVRNGSADAPWHTLIEADNYHALQLLEYLYAEQVDCIYIDPPYNTGARDWKYNNDYVDSNDGWRHSKWLAFMEKRLKLAKRLLKPDTGVLIVTIDEHEVHHLGMLLEREFPEAYRQLVTIVINQKGVAQGRLSRAEEYALFCFNPAVTLAAHHDDLLSPDRGDSKGLQAPRWERLLRGGTNSRREDRYGLFFPITVDPKKRKIIEIGDPLPRGQQPNLNNLSARRIAWPLRTDGTLGNWRVSPPTLRLLLKEGYVKLGGFDEARGTWTILYLGQKAQNQIEAGVIEVVDRNEVTGEVSVRYAESQQRSIKTVWHRATHDADPRKQRQVDNPLRAARHRPTDPRQNESDQNGDSRAMDAAHCEVLRDEIGREHDRAHNDERDQQALRRYRSLKNVDHWPASSGFLRPASSGTHAKLKATATTPATSTTGPPFTAATTFCCAAIATTMGMYISDQNSTPNLKPGDSPPAFTIHQRIATSSSIAMPTPPTFAFTPMASPSRSPSAAPTTVQSARMATP